MSPCVIIYNAKQAQAIAHRSMQVDRCRPGSDQAGPGRHMRAPTKATAKRQTSTQAGLQPALLFRGTFSACPRRTAGSSRAAAGQAQQKSETGPDLREHVASISFQDTTPGWYCANCCTAMHTQTCTRHSQTIITRRLQEPRKQGAMLAVWSQECCWYSRARPSWVRCGVRRGRWS